MTSTTTLLVLIASMPIVLLATDYKVFYENEGKGKIGVVIKGTGVGGAGGVPLEQVEPPSKGVSYWNAKNWDPIDHHKEAKEKTQDIVSKIQKSWGLHGQEKHDNNPEWEKLRSEMNAQNSKMEELSSKMNSLGQEMNGIGGNVNVISKKMEDFGRTMDNYGRDMTAIGVKMGSCGQRSDWSGMRSAQGEMRQVQIKMADVQREMAQAQQEMQKVQRQDQLERSQVQEKMSKVQSEMAEVSNEIEEIRQKMKNAGMPDVYVRTTADGTHHVYYMSEMHF
ncbi:hypothetical protein Ddc_12624 [Ditylenchus destructor]|nr:hypothetical protein Ddc_12624 [Ditylenchus destructor]